MWLGAGGDVSVEGLSVPSESPKKRGSLLVPAAASLPQCLECMGHTGTQRQLLDPFKEPGTSFFFQVHCEGRPQAGPCGVCDLGPRSAGRPGLGGDETPPLSPDAHTSIGLATCQGGSTEWSDRGFYRVSSSSGPQDLSTSPALRQGGRVTGFVLSSFDENALS